MPFKKILVAVDGSACSQLAIDYALSLGTAMNSLVTGVHVIDPRLMDLFIAPEFAEALGFATSVSSSEAVFAALTKIGNVLLDLFKKQAKGKVEAETLLSVGWIAEEIVRHGDAQDLIVIGHHGKGERQKPVSTIIGSVAERVAVFSKKPVLVASHALAEVRNILIAFDGSEPARGALLLGQALAQKTGRPLKAIVVAKSENQMSEARLTLEQGLTLLKQNRNEDTFAIEIGKTSEVILEYADGSRALLIIGAYGYGTAEDNVLGSTTTSVIRKARTSVLIYR